MLSSFAPSISVKAVVGSMLVLALAGCGQDASTTAPAPSPYNGTGTEALGSYNARATASTGLYDVGHYLPVGLTHRVRLFTNGSTLTLQANGNIALGPNPANGTYRGTTTWTPTEGMLSGLPLHETWTLAFSGDHVVLTVAGATTDGAVTGTVTLELSDASYSFDSSVYSFFLGSITDESGDDRFVGSVSSLFLYDGNPGTTGRWTADYATIGIDQFVFDAFIKDGNTLKAGGFPPSAGYLSNEELDRFATITVTLDSLERPESATVTVQDFDLVDNDGLIDIEPATYTVTSRNFITPAALFTLYPLAAPATLHVTAVTAGGLLESYFGAVGHDNVGWFHSVGLYAYLDKPNNSIHAGGAVSPTQRHAVLWDKHFTDYYNAESPYELDNSRTTNERLTIDITYSGLGAANLATGGTVMLEVFDSVTDSLLATESMTFTVVP